MRGAGLCSASCQTNLLKPDLGIEKLLSNDINKESGVYKKCWFRNSIFLMRESG
jgi:hypothetical protein